MPRTVMVVDDSPGVRTLLRGALERAGFSVLEAGDGEAAMEFLDGRPLGLVVCDLAMPRMDGMSFMRYLRLHPRYRYTPLVVLSTETRRPMRDEARKQGAQAFINKPCTPAQLVGAVQRLCV
jgi:two-component system, chemotaxis family, chemotaxis protein CheY